MDKAFIWLWLSLHFGQGTRLYRTLLEHFGSVENIYDCIDDDLYGQNWLTDTQKAKLLNKNLKHALEVKQWCEDNDVKIITYADDNYPFLLRSLNDFPAVLYCLGNLPEFSDELVIGVVGTRKMTVRGEKMAFNLGYCLAKGGAYVVSGMAMGIDGTAQRGVLAAGGTTIAVLGSGINVIYPKYNENLYYAIAKTGAVITEYPPNTPPNSTHFPIRNRIISGLSHGVVVVEGDEFSGSMITAKKARLQNRDLFAVPGPAGEHFSSGPNSLIKTGALIAENAIDILEYYLDGYSQSVDIKSAKALPKTKREIYKLNAAMEDGSFYRKSSDDKLYDMIKKFTAFKRQKKEEEKKISKKQEVKVEIDLSKLSEDERKVYNSLETGKMVTDDDIIKLGVPISDIGAIMLNLEINGLIDTKPGGFYVKK